MLKVFKEPDSKKTIKKKRVSKKTKKSWRKHVDVKDVDQFLEEERLEERLGKRFADRTNDELFIVDSKADNSLLKLYQSKSVKRLALRNAEPKYCAVLKPHTAVPAMKLNMHSMSEKKILLTEKKLTKKLLKSVENKSSSNDVENSKKKRNVRGEFVSDAWIEESSTPLSKTSCEWFNGDTVRLNEPVKKKIRVRSSLTKNVAAVEPPHPGLSYNPAYEDHQQLLNQVVENEKQLMKEEAHLDRVTTKMFKRISPKEQEKRWLEESSEGLPAVNGEIKSEPESEDDTHPGEVKSINPPAKLNKKTQQQRRKQREQKKLALEKKISKVEKKKVGDIYKLKVLKKQIENKETIDEKAKTIRLIKKKKKEENPKKLSKTKFKAADLDFKMAEELSGNLVHAAPTGNLLKDRYQSLQQRSIVAPSIRSLKLNKARVKKFTKPDHKITLNSTSPNKKK